MYLYDSHALQATVGLTPCVCTSVPTRAQQTDHTRYTQSRFRVRRSAFALWASVSHT